MRRESSKIDTPAASASVANVWRRWYGPRRSTPAALSSDEHYEIAVTLNNLAAIHQRRGDYQRTEALYRRALSIKQALLGPDHPDVAVTLNNLATTRRAQGDANDAAALLHRALAIVEHTLQPEHPTIAAVRANLTDAIAAATNASSQPRPPGG